MREEFPLDPIDVFSGEYHWLSNFFPAKFVFEGKQYPSVEHAYQAHKTMDPETFEAIRKAVTPGIAKRMGYRTALRPDWDKLKVMLMRELIEHKFEQNPELRQKLCETRGRELIEGNNWGDRFWGCVKEAGEWVGENTLGKLLMETRDLLCGGQQQKGT
jgi:ribA/ribD-fused uncharacterized protein